MSEQIPTRIIKPKRSFEQRLFFACFAFFKSVSFSILIGIIVAGLFSAGLYVLAVPPDSVYGPGDTLDPNCSPDVTSPNYKANCSVTTPAVYSFSSNNFSGTGNFSGGAITGTSITDSGLTSGRVPYITTGGLLTDSANLTFDGQNLTITAPTTGWVTGLTLNNVSIINVSTITGSRVAGSGSPIGMNLDFTDLQDITSGGTDNLVGANFDLAKSGTLSNTITTVKPYQGFAQFAATFNRAGAQQGNLYVLDFIITNNSTINKASGNMTLNDYGAKYTFSQSITSTSAPGTNVHNVYGAYFTGGGYTAAGWTTNYYGIYNNVAAGYTNNWFLYNNSASNNLMGLDNSKTYFGTGIDASIYYDATNLIINPKEVGTGYLGILGNINLNDNKLIGGTTTTSDLFLQTTSGTGATGADMHFLVGDNGGTEAMTILNSGYVGIGTTAPDRALELNSATGINLRLTYNDADGTATNYADLLTTSGGDLTINASGGDISLGSNTLTTTGTVTTGNLQTGAAGVDGQLTIYSEQGATDYNLIFQPNAAMTESSTYVWPVAKPATNKVLQSDSSGNLTWETYLTSVTAHNLLSATHGDATVGTVVRGDIITGQGASPTWTRKTKGSAGQLVTFDANDVIYTTATYPATTTANQIFYSTATNVVGGGTGLTFDATTLTVATAGTQMKLSYGVDADDYSTFATDANGNLTITAVTSTAGGDIKFTPGTSGNPQLLSSSGTLALGGTGNTKNENLTFDFETTANTVAIASTTGVTDITWTGGITMRGSTTNTLVTRVKAGAPDESDYNGAIVINSGASPGIYYRYGDAWHYAGNTAGFQIPKFETIDPLSGKEIKEGDFVLGMINEKMSDDALHGTWVRWDTVKAQLLKDIKAELKATGIIGTGAVQGENEVIVPDNPKLNIPGLSNIKNALSSLGISIQNGITNIKQLTSEKITTQVARVQKLEMVDGATGEIYCTWLENGEWKKTKGECGSSLRGVPSEARGNEAIPAPESQTTGEIASSPEAPRNDEGASVTALVPVETPPAVEQPAPAVAPEPASVETPLPTEQPAPAPEPVPAETPPAVEQQIIPPVGELIEQSASSFMNGVWNFTRWISVSSARKVSEIIPNNAKEMAKNSFGRILSLKDNLPIKEIKFFTAGIFEPLKKWFGQ